MNDERDCRYQEFSPEQSPPSIEELDALHQSLNSAQREELLECLLIASSKGGDSVMQALAPWLLVAASNHLLGEGHSG